MAILNCFMAVTASATPMSPDSLSPSVPDPRQTKILLPKKKPEKWSTGMAPGDYGGPPPATKLRKYWGGEGEDPITSDEFIWNKDFMPRMERLVRDSNAPPIPIQSNRVKEVPSGFLSINRVMSLDSMDVDLSKELSGPTKRQLDMLVEPKAKPDGPPRIRWRLAPTRKEQEKWDRAAKAATGGSEAMFRELKRPKGDPQVLAAQSREQYSKLKNKLQIITLGIGVVGLASAYVSYSPEITLSYGAGFAGSLVYMRMLGNTIDSMAGGAKGLIKGAIGQPRLLVPVLLVMLYNRWNGILVPEYGFVHLDLIPMLVGFFTYKVATFSLAIEEALTVTQKDPST